MFSQPVSVAELDKMVPPRAVQPPQTIADSMTNKTISEGRLRSNARYFFLNFTPETCSLEVYQGNLFKIPPFFNYK